ncbi:dTDP-4-amino-4,6-dideoxyglucose formyltransferase [Pontibacter oryzae]|uniref:dTDP-4-amino-4,6-dideoxyglucose formyltransferase n=1 Tax=Pontibacter oryzae TaxID=2304593 RepID=A0A399SHN2_9BACT|nr:dTDP-4-amino-4,6-dideoxyglucose formyltransferase [Pontibacter oryzae]RIJ42778.1 dTDP-4-amino-4,6-dideoxyglucose formyltransferase [Pontibacter oryzae]
MVKKVLVVSDNQHILKSFDSIAKKSADKIDIQYAISPSSNLEDFTGLGEITVINLKSEQRVSEIIAIYDLVISAHCKQLFPAVLVNSVRCINIHPGYNPINRGWYPQVFAIIHKIPVGATIHEMDEELDNGAIIAREIVPQYSWDTSLTLYNRVVKKELELLEKHFTEIINGNYNKIRPEEKGNLYLKKDFNNFLLLDLEQKGTMEEILDKLRALTHGTYKNAYYIDKQTGKKVFVSLQLIVDE